MRWWWCQPRWQSSLIVGKSNKWSKKRRFARKIQIIRTIGTIINFIIKILSQRSLIITLSSLSSKHKSTKNRVSILFRFQAIMVYETAFILCFSELLYPIVNPLEILSDISEKLNSNCQWMLLGSVVVINWHTSVSLVGEDQEGKLVPHHKPSSLYP